MQVKKSRFTSRSENGVQLPIELITEILVRLPVKSLLKSKCVSKSWLSLISSPVFISSHFSLSSSREEGQFSNHQLLFKILSPNKPVIKACFLNSTLHEPSTRLFDVECPFLNPDDDSVSIVGVVNGLVCLSISNEKELCVWNPVLRKSKRFSSPNVSILKDGKDVIYGFGYDESNDDYKVVSVLRGYHTYTGIPFEAEVMVYSLLADSWRRIEDFKGSIPWDDTVKYADGKIHWPAWESSALCRKLKIVTLDTVSDKLGELQWPGCGDADDWLFGVLGGRLFVLGDYYLKQKMELWVMDKQNGVEESWSKVVSIPYVDVHGVEQVICVLRNGETVLANGLRLLVYHPKHNELRNIKLDGCKSDFEAFVYVESLVWPKNESC